MAEEDILTTSWIDEYQSSDALEIEETVRGFLIAQARAAADQNRPLRRGTHAKGVCVRAVFEVADVTTRRDPALAGRLACGLFGKPGSYPTTVRFANSNPTVDSDWEPDVRSLSFAVELPAHTDPGEPRVARHDWSLQSSPTLPFNDVHAFAVYARVLGAPNEAVALGSMSFADQLLFVRTRNAVIEQQRQPVRPYQQLRYWSNVPFRHGPSEVVKYSASPLAANPAQALAHGNPSALLDELIRHLDNDATMSAFDFAVQFLDTERMTWQGRRRDAAFWIDNASVEWPEAQAPFHTIARLTLVSRSQLRAEACEQMYIDVTEHSAPEHAPVGRINRARRYAEVASRRARGEAL